MTSCPLLRGQLSPLLKLIVPGLLLAGLYRGSEWARWLLMISLLGFGVLVMYLTTSLMPYSIDIWLHRFVCSAASGGDRAVPGAGQEGLRALPQLRRAARRAEGGGQETGRRTGQPPEFGALAGSGLHDSSG